MIRRTYPLRRLSPEAGGKALHDLSRAEQRLAQLNTEHRALQQAIRSELGTETLWRLQANARNAVALQQLQEEIAA
ncbi:hypothetical protein [Stutzerimonas stutzeri]|uniref:hypothetical protein n=1 Tax=Stutzerimonas stutzeri TaxID=316 RepID=UPI000D0BE51A|nr:hypothetical protein [Stutzerimonas stutzeri]AWK98657.1 hypothetical protein C6Y50_01380 [Stutzerimonas stutzeri]|tara:strand:+ start:5824 stop:6051 length:228 start_codon:yes stop_codon:yes gene_type:complete